MIVQSIWFSLDNVLFQGCVFAFLCVSLFVCLACVCVSFNSAPVCLEAGKIRSLISLWHSCCNALEGLSLYFTYGLWQAIWHSWQGQRYQPAQADGEMDTRGHGQIRLLPESNCKLLPWGMLLLPQVRMQSCLMHGRRAGWKWSKFFQTEPKSLVSGLIALFSPHFMAVTANMETYGKTFAKIVVRLKHIKISVHFVFICM